MILIQAHIRGWIARRAVERDKRNIIIIQVGFARRYYCLSLETIS